jgi:hypothetical protein
MAWLSAECGGGRVTGAPLGMTSAETTRTRSFDELAKLIERTPSLHVRIQRTDGSAIEGDLLDVGYTDLLLVEKATEKRVHVSALELRVLEMNVPRRGREWMLTAFAIPAATAALVGYARLPWVPSRPSGDDVLVGFMILVAIGAGVISIPAIRKWLASWLTRWQRVYPPVAPHHEI